MCHEFSGVISEVGQAIVPLSVGHRVVVHPNVPCDDCLYCEEGHYNLCSNIVSVGFSTGTGGFAESAVVPAKQIHALPDSVSFEEGALVEPLAVGLHAVRRAEVLNGDTVAVFGAGPIGLTVIRAAAATGANKILVSEPNDTRRTKAAEIGADVTIDPISDDPVSQIRSQTAGGVDIAFEFAGIEQAINSALHSTKKAGRVVVGSVWEERPQIDATELVMSEREIRGTFCYGFPPRSNRTEFATILRDLEAGRIDVDPFITGTIDLENIVAEGFEVLLNGDSEHVKLLVEP
jgi:(R,R)-butanediol dehydrogenase/meso-butanediol dehydrogenase/diacetyl reductase